MDLLCNDTRHFKFTTDQFSLFDYILFDASKRMNLLREKVLIFGVRPNTGEAPLEIVCCVLVCHNKESAVKLNNINKLVETHFLLRYEDYKLEVLLRGEHLDVLRAKVRDARCERDETLFPMKKNNGHGWINDYVEVCLRSESNETLVEKIVPINKEDRVPRPQPDVTTSFSRSTFHNATVNTSLRHNERKTDSFWSRCTLL
uniref:E3 ubiquitin-protein ligase TTC3-like n=1 Tax=Phallusia mammillata TaxID=59560 RepID=A0A6F9DV56_9ASCI|nr:E3 ubiquitin-protein ligase TTC3-like [Phallusia mammillata]